MIEVNIEPITGIQFSRDYGEIHEYGVMRIPEDISLKEANKMVQDEEARFLYGDEINKYINKEE